MPWCPKCRLEYREGFEKCSECDVDLVEELTEEPEAVVEPDDMGVFLVSTANGFEADIIGAKLEAYGVPVMRRHRETGDYLKVFMGASPFGVDVYVPSRLLEKAKEILLIMPEVVEEDEEVVAEDMQEEMEAEESIAEFNEKKQKWLYWLLGIPALIFIVFFLFDKI